LLSTPSEARLSERNNNHYFALSLVVGAAECECVYICKKKKSSKLSRPFLATTTDAAAAAARERKNRHENMVYIFMVCILCEIIYWKTILKSL
jgi:hypothetical protein